MGCACFIIGRRNVLVIDHVVIEKVIDHGTELFGLHQLDYFECK